MLHNNCGAMGLCQHVSPALLDVASLAFLPLITIKKQFV